MSQLPHLVRDLIAIMNQGATLIDALSPEAYCACPPGLKASSIGAHYRHHIEHVQLLLEGARGEVDYDRRRRDPSLEHVAAVALERTSQLIEQLKALTEDDLAREVTVIHQSSLEQDQRPSCTSTLGRELLFVLSHAVHHYALMGIIAELHGQRPCQEDFGVMPSTLSYRASQHN